MEKRCANPDCGKLLHPSKRSKYCPDCTKQRVLKWHREYNRTQRQWVRRSGRKVLVQFPDSTVKDVYFQSEVDHYRAEGAFPPGTKFEYPKQEPARS